MHRRRLVVHLLSRYKIFGIACKQRAGRFCFYDYDVSICLAIQIRTVIGAGSAAEGTHGVHGSPLGATDLANVKSKFGFDPTQVHYY